MTDFERSMLTSIDSLAALYAQPIERIAKKRLDHVNDAARVNGRARICQDAELKLRFAVNGKEPTTVMIVMVEETFQHCAKALVRSDLWNAGSRGRPQGVPTMGEFVAARNPGTDSAAINVAYNESIPRELY